MGREQSVLHSRYDTALYPDIGRNLLQTFRMRIVDERSMTRAGEEDAVLH